MYLHICDFLKNRLKEGPIFRIGINEIKRVYRKTYYLIEYTLLCYKLESSMTNYLLKTGKFMFNWGFFVYFYQEV